MSDPTAAAERLSKGWRAYKDGQHNEGVDAITVAEAWLDEHDPTPIDEAWLRSVGSNNSGDGIDRITFGPIVWYIDEEDEGWFITDEGSEVRIAAPATKGQFRRLAGALGLTLKETSE